MMFLLNYLILLMGGHKDGVPRPEFGRKSNQKKTDLTRKSESLPDPIRYYFIDVDTK